MKLLFLLTISFGLSLSAFAKVVRYELSINKKTVNLSGKKKVDFALAINDQIPGPTLEFTEGDEAEIVVKNDSEEHDVSTHWHGILLDPYYDGVPYVNSPPIMPGDQFTFKFKVRQHGTYWFHSHTAVQEQKGVYGSIVIHPKNKTISYDRDLVAVLSDWSDEDPNQILKNLRKEGEYYQYKKRTIRSYLTAYKEGSLSNHLYNEMTRMGGMDFSDVGYDAFLINGKRSSTFEDLRPGEKVRIRIINAAASSYFNVSLGDVSMKVISADGTDIDPLQAKEIFIAPAETYDVLYEVPANKSLELRANSQDGTGYGSLWIGKGEKVPAPNKERPDLYMKMYMGSFWDTLKYGGSMTKPPVDYSKMGHGMHGGMSMGKGMNMQGDMSSMDHSQMKSNEHDHSMNMKMDMKDHSAMTMDEEVKVIPTLTVDNLKAQGSTVFDEKIPRHDVKLVLDGDMERYIWVINGKAMFEDYSIPVQQNKVVRFTYVNNSMMNHPFHLHGHFFRVVNDNGEKSPLKHTVDVPPFGQRTIEFYTNEPGEWMLHCHNLYHMQTGMARTVKYMSFVPREDIQKLQKNDPHLGDHIYYRGELEASTNHAQTRFNFMDTWNEVEFRAEGRRDFGWQGEGDLFYKRWLNKYTSLIAGGTLVEQYGAAVAGVGYVLPFRIATHALIDHKGRARLDLLRRFQWSEYIYSDAEFTFRQKQDSEFEVTLMYQRQWAWSAGLMFTERSAGVGAQYFF
jgi:CopA family copper-resistance protein